MNTFLQRIELNKRNCCLLVIIIGGLCTAAAQAQTPALPALPTLSGLPSLTPATPQAPSASTPSAPTASAPPVPSLPPIPMPGTNNNETAAADKPAADAILNPLADLPPPNPGAGDSVAQTVPTTTPPPATPPTQTAENGDEPAIPAATEMPNLALPVPPVPDNAPIPMPTVALPGPKTIEAPLVVADTKPKIKTWETKLAPSIIPPKTNFNYRRQILPPTIASATYDRNNRHLPPAWTREDYANLLFTSVMNNDVESTRAILNDGNYLNVTNQNGETPLAVANRLGARNVAALLIARGARI